MHFYVSYFYGNAEVLKTQDIICCSQICVVCVDNTEFLHRESWIVYDLSYNAHINPNDFKFWKKHLIISIKNYIIIKYFTIMHSNNHLELNWTDTCLIFVYSKIAINTLQWFSV